jgi:hypothetical protein
MTSAMVKDVVALLSRWMRDELGLPRCRVACSTTERALATRNDMMVDTKEQKYCSVSG